ALAENVNDSYKNELIHNTTWDDVVDVEIATFKWVTWWNEARVHQGLGYRTPAEVESEFCKTSPSQEIIEIEATPRNKTRGTSVGIYLNDSNRSRNPPA